MKIGKLTFISDVEPHITVSGHRVRKSKWLCDCGNTKVISFSHVKCGHTKSCGCVRKPHGMTGKSIFIT